MSENIAQQWLRSQNKFSKTIQKKAHKIAVSSGKGGVGKTSFALKAGETFASLGHKTLIIDCDHNLSNTAIKLGMPIDNRFLEYIWGERSFEDSIHRVGDLDLFAGCSGNLELFKRSLSLENIIIEIIRENESKYDFIILDCAAGVHKDTTTLAAYCDTRAVVVTPDKSSITDAYSMIKILNKQFDIKETHIIANRISSNRQYKNIVGSLAGTVDRFLDCKIRFLGGIKEYKGEVDKFDQDLLKFSDSEISKNFNKIILRLSEECISASGNYMQALEQDVRNHRGKECVNVFSD